MLRKPVPARDLGLESLPWRTIKAIAIAYFALSMMLKLSLAIVGNPEDVTIAQDAVEDRLCGILFAFQDAIGVLTLVLFIGGGAVYAISHLSPNAGNMKGSIQGYSAMMLYGAIIGLVLVLISPYLVDMIVNLVTQSYVTQCIDTDVNDVGI